jgi:hypothetical protein
VKERRRIAAIILRAAMITAIACHQPVPRLSNPGTIVRTNAASYRPGDSGYAVLHNPTVHPLWVNLCPMKAERQTPNGWPSDSAVLYDPPHPSGLTEVCLTSAASVTPGDSMVRRFRIRPDAVSGCVRFWFPWVRFADPPASNDARGVRTNAFVIAGSERANTRCN